MNNRDLELLSAYLDGELKTSELSKLESRLETDPDLASVLSDIREARTLLRKMPMRKAPRNFTVTRKMVGQNPPLPRAYPFFRLATTLATLLLFFTFGLNFVGSQMSGAQIYGIGGAGGGGGGEFETYSADEAPAMEEPAAPESEMSAQDAAGTGPAGEPVEGLAPPMGTELPPSEESARVAETPSQKNGENADELNQQIQPPESPQPSPWVSSTWQVALAAIAVAGALLLGLMRILAAQRWK